jgi:hypothetical protein
LFAKILQHALLDAFLRVRNVIKSKARFMKLQAFFAAENTISYYDMKVWMAVS